jgi:chromosome segregation protein
MRLKKLIVQGFKSFADRTEFVFDSPITGIVGPNGCGKSNVVDAFKWVLGEQSAKSLRGDAMMDVIFNGSAARKPSGLAEVVLVFENPPREDGSRALMMDVDEVAVGRRLYRDGTSEYQVNNGTSRLKDIRELFLDTGVGADAYSVIEQGKVSAMLEANPAERRIIFEEAAGISKYKVKKKETLRKLEKVDQNLLRVNDVVVEVDKQLRSVKLQAGKARVYQEHTVRLNELRLGYVLHEYHTHHTQSVELNQNLEETQFRLDDLTGDLTTRQNELNAKKEQFDALSQNKQRNEYELVQANAALQSAQQKQHYAAQQLKQMEEQLQSFDRDKLSLEEKLAAVTESLTVETARLQSLTAELQQHREQIEQRQQAFRDGQLQLNQLNREIEQNKSAVLDLMRKLAQVNSRIAAIEIERKNIASQQQRLGDRRQIVVGELEVLAAKKQELQLKLDEAVANIADQQAKLEEKKREAAAHGKQIATIGEQLGAAKEHRSGLLSRQKLLKDLEAKREGVSEGVKSVLRQREAKFPFIRGLVADILQVDVEHAHAIEAALDGRDQWLVTNDQASAVAAEEALGDLEGRVNVICADRLVPPSPGTPGEGRGEGDFERKTALEIPNHPHPNPLPEYRESGSEVYDWNQHAHRIRIAADLVRVEPEDLPIAQHLLGKTIVTDNLAIAVDLHRVGPKGYRYVTHAGEVLEGDGTLRAGPLTAAMGLLSRRSELQAVNLQIADVDQRIAALTGQLSQGNVAAKEMEEQQNTLRNAVYQANTVKVEVTSSIAQNNDKQNSLNREQPVLDRELAGLQDQFGRLAAEEEKLAAQKTAYETDQTNRQKSIEEMTAKHAQLAEELKESSETLTNARVQLGQVQEQQLACQQQVQRQTVARGELSQQIQRITQSTASVAGRRGGIEHDLATAKHAESVSSQQKQELAGHIERLKSQVAEAGEAVKSLSVAVEKIRADHTSVEQDLHALQLEAGEVKVRLESLITRTMEEFQLNLPEKYNSLEGGYQPVDQDWPAVASEIKELRDKISRLGNVNVDAITEMEELTTRQTFLATQLADLSASKKQLEELIETINIESAARFEQTFNTVREHFQGMFRKLFGGGKADVYLETELTDNKAADGIGGSPVEGAEPIAKKKFDILDAGIEIIARPPGKQPATISQLSGGEKTMTCIALLMSIFKSKPSPFCILDEVDAALDEANNQRFNLIIQEFLDQSQFIVITHSKRTMQIADVLYGVTMQEQGVSKRVSVKFEQVDGQGRIAESAAA